MTGDTPTVHVPWRFDTRTRRWRHLDTCQYRTILVAEVPRVECPEHGVHQVPVPWSESNSRFTALFEAQVVGWLAEEASISAVSRQLGLDWSTTAEDDVRIKGTRFLWLWNPHGSVPGMRVLSSWFLVEPMRQAESGKPAAEKRKVSLERNRSRKNHKNAPKGGCVDRNGLVNSCSIVKGRRQQPACVRIREDSGCPVQTPISA